MRSDCEDVQARMSYGGRHLVMVAGSFYQNADLICNFEIYVGFKKGQFSLIMLNWL